MSELASITIPVSTGSLAAYNRDKYQPDSVHGIWLRYNTHTAHVCIVCGARQKRYKKRRNKKYYSLITSMKVVGIYWLIDCEYVSRHTSHLETARKITRIVKVSPRLACNKLR